MFQRHLFSIVALSFACGGGEPAPIEMPPLHVNAKPPAERARWVFAGPEEELRAKLDLGDGRTLYVGEHGRRELGKPGELTHATTLALEGLAGVLQDGKRFVFVATDGDIYVSTEPLGALDRAGKPRTQADALTSVTTGRATILGIAGGKLMRSSDYGATWRALEYSQANIVGRAAAVALDSKGNGVLVHLPQRLFVTHDDGASWGPLVSPQDGAVSAMRDGADRIFVTGYQQRTAVLEGNTLVATKDRPTPIYAAPSSTVASEGEEPDSRMLLAGDHVVQIALRDKSVAVRSARLGKPLPHEWTSHPNLVPSGEWNATMMKHIATSNGELIYLRGVDPNEGAAREKEVSPLTNHRPTQQGLRRHVAEGRSLPRDAQ